MRTACYCMTRNIYRKVIPSLNSLLIHSDADVYLLTEDDSVGFRLPDRVRVINVSGQQWFRQDGPNYHCGWSWMVMMRMALCHVFPDLDRILALDVDTIVDQDITALWDLPIGNCYCAAAVELHRSKPGSLYFNNGVTLWHLDKMRDGKADEIIRDLNTHYYEYAEQDCMNILLRGKILPMPPEYNANRFTGLDQGIRIRHFAAEPGWYEREPLVQKYKEVRIL